MRRLKKYNKIHVSIDDVIDLWKDLTIHDNEYRSIFCNKTLAYLYWLHNKYGVNFSLYCFYACPGFTLGQVSDKFKNEFIYHSTWLKFGFHSLDEKTYYGNSSSQKAKNDYNKTVQELIRITGSGQCIDRLIRLHGFTGNRNSIMAMKNTEYGIEGLLCSDDKRLNYYLDKKQNKLVLRYSNYYDNDMGLYFFKTNIRIEKCNIIKWKIRKKCSLLKRKEFFIFTHEKHILNVKNGIRLKIILEKIMI